MLVIPHRFKKIGLHNLVVRRIFSDILLGLKRLRNTALGDSYYRQKLAKRKVSTSAKRKKAKVKPSL
jgi:hypothetical protein